MSGNGLSRQVAPVLLSLLWAASGHAAPPDDETIGLLMVSALQADSFSAICDQRDSKPATGRALEALARWPKQQAEARTLADSTYPELVNDLKPLIEEAGGCAIAKLRQLRNDSVREFDVRLAELKALPE
ncbi:MAG TPA: hypothetical protein VLC08_00250 [Chitinolyticbacter sp.]|nr:hypothetical protein [Chitinolyticbacter sp.]